MDYLKLLEHSYKVENKYCERQQKTRYEFLSKYIFDFTTYDGKAAELFGQKAVEVCEALLKRKTFDYIKNYVNYTWYLIMCNMPFFQGKLEWGACVRGAWWDFGMKKQITFRSTGLWDENVQHLEPFLFDVNEWLSFIAAIIEFAKN